MSAHRMMGESPGLRSADFAMEGQGIYFMILRACVCRAGFGGENEGYIGLCVCVCVKKHVFWLL